MDKLQYILNGALRELVFEGGELTKRLLGASGAF